MFFYLSILTEFHMLRKLLPFLIYALEMKISYQIFLQLLIIKMIIDSKRFDN